MWIKREDCTLYCYIRILWRQALYCCTKEVSTVGCVGCSNYYSTVVGRDEEEEEACIIRLE